MTGEKLSTGAAPVHPLQALCWMWLVGGIFLAGLGVLMILSCLYPHPKVMDRIPPGDGLWMEFGIIGLAGHAAGLAYIWFWHRFAVSRELTRRTWRIGLWLIVLGGVFLFLTRHPLPAMIFFLTIIVWAHGNTRKFFERA